MKNNIRIKSGVQIPRLLYDRSYFKVTFFLAMFGLLGVLLFIGKIVWSEYSGNVVFTAGDQIGLSSSLFIFGMFLPTSLILYISNTFLKIIDTIIEDDNDSAE